MSAGDMHSMCLRVPVTRPFTALFVPRRPGFGAPVELEDIKAELVRVSDFSVVASLEEGLSLAGSGAPHFEYAVTGSLPDDVLPGALYSVRFSGTHGRRTYRAVQTLVVEADLATALQNLAALTVAGGGFG